MHTPTHEAYAELLQAFDHFNSTLFSGTLEQPLFTLQRERRTFGYCSKQRFVSRTSGAMVDEIALNPAYFAIRSIRESLSTLAHEMVHQWQFRYGKPGRRGYHNLEWGSKMEHIGLMPSNTGKPGGMKTGEQMTHYIIDGGAFDTACQQLLTDEFTLSWLDRYPPERPTLAPMPLPRVYSLPGAVQDDPGGLEVDEEPEGPNGRPARALPIAAGVVLPSLEPENRSNRVKYVCDECKAQAWGKPGLNLFCGGQSLKRGEEVIALTHGPLTMRPIALFSAATFHGQTAAD